MVFVDIVAPVRNEADTLPSFVEQVFALDLPPATTLRVTFVEDGSTDDTIEVLRRIASGNERVRYFSLERGYGQGPATVYGIRQCRGDAIVMMDCDGSHPVNIVPEMIERFLAGASVVQATRRNFDAQGPARRLGSRLFFSGLRLVAGDGLKTQIVYFRLMSKDISDRFLSWPHLWWYLRFPDGFPDRGVTANIPFDGPARAGGESNYSLARLAALALDGLITLIPMNRLMVLAGIALIAAAVAVLHGQWLAGGAIALVLMAVVARRWWLGRGNVLDLMRVKEAGGFDTAS